MIVLWIYASLRIWSAVICTSAASLFFMGGGFISIIVMALINYLYNLAYLYYSIMQAFAALLLLNDHFASNASLLT